MSSKEMYIELKNAESDDLLKLMFEDGTPTEHRALMLHHLQFNCYPPIDPAFTHTAFKAANLYNLGDPTHPIDMPNGVTLTAGEIVEQLNLTPWISDDVIWSNEED